MKRTVCSAKRYRAKARRAARPALDPIWNMDRAIDVLRLFRMREIIVVSIANGLAAVSTGPDNNATGHASEKERDEAAAHIAAELPTSLENEYFRKQWYRVVGKELADGLKEADGRPANAQDAFRRMLGWGLKEAGDDARREQYVRIGKRWQTDARGRKRLMKPIELPWPTRLLWLVQRAYATVARFAGSDDATPLPFTYRAFTPDEQERHRRSDAAAAKPDLDVIAAQLLLRESAARLTSQQRTVVTLVAEGFTRGQVADQLGISLATVRVHLHHAHKSR